MISITSYYGSSASAENNAKKVTINGTCFYFSYETLVAVSTVNHGTKVLKNYWGPITGKHLNAIDGGNKNSRVDQDEFDDFVESLEITKVIKHLFK